MVDSSNLDGGMETLDSNIQDLKIAINSLAEALYLVLEPVNDSPMKDPDEDVVDAVPMYAPLVMMLNADNHMLSDQIKRIRELTYRLSLRPSEEKAETSIRYQGV